MILTIAKIILVFMALFLVTTLCVVAFMVARELLTRWKEWKADEDSRR